MARLSRIAEAECLTPFTVEQLDALKERGLDVASVPVEFGCPVLDQAGLYWNIVLPDGRVFSCTIE